ncbi:MAG: hypothetical protein M5R36_16225 [Deltaproteobacteria bacterium]|nr:hypothetical protein [Deltaproteobacteria bacterium]
MSVVEIKGWRKRSERQRARAGAIWCGLMIEPGELTVIAGPSGREKTLLNLIGALDVLDCGNRFHR